MSGGAAMSKDSEATVTAVREEYCRTLHERLVTSAKRRVALEAEEARDLVLAEEAGIWRVFGYVSMHEYMERELHYGRHAANERLRVAHDLFELPMLAKPFRSGEAPFSVMRELTRVVVPENQEEWMVAVEGKTAAQVQQMVSGLRKGANPEDRPDPKLVRHRIVMDVDAETYAIWRAGRSHANQRHGARLSDDEFARQTARAVIEPGGDGTSAACLHAVTTCTQCKRSSLVANGREVPLDMATTLRMLCDSARIGDLESDELERLVPAIPKPTKRKALVRAMFACEVPGCRSKKHLDCHHIVFRSQGGSNKLSNIVILCSGHHQQLHEGRLCIAGRSPDGLVFEFRRDWDGGVHRTMTTIPDDVFVEDTEVSPAGTDRTVPAGTDRTVPAGTDRTVPTAMTCVVPAGTEGTDVTAMTCVVPAGTEGTDVTAMTCVVPARTETTAMTCVVPAGTDGPVAAGMECVVPAGTDGTNPTAMTCVAEGGTDGPVPAGTEWTDGSVPAGTDGLVPAATERVVSAGANSVVPAGTDGTDAERAEIDRVVAAMMSAPSRTERPRADRTGPTPAASLTE
ncbi:MAG: hypothetical protein JWP01_160 [Myxococcales bacterium]|nr:hypothetical protein [Myxococcales bacterium]